jgi:predicted anti-sigma-YlaC factor YlaD
MGVPVSSDTQILQGWSVAELENSQERGDQNDSGAIDCIDVVHMLADFVDGDLEELVHQSLAEHLKGCAHCRRLYTQYSQTIQVAGALRNEGLPKGVQQRLRATLEREFQGQLRLRRK